MDMIIYLFVSALLSMLIMLSGVFYAGIKLGFHSEMLSCCSFLILVSIVTLPIPIINIIIGIIAAYACVEVTK